MYVIIDNKCYFSGAKNELFTSTINAAESIITAIAKQEGVSVWTLEWFDLQTHCGYSSKQPGQFELDQVVLTENLRGTHIYDFFVKEWDPVSCPDEIRTLFKEYIG